ncbi:MAG TPA: A/G-specific adenine glycosylase [Cyclobacteriaceae bacterium]|nr:A/G-specific adenine glycosylase [Cyclobacteriaceae bacterium]HMV07728.1 A/G-specific adenine glycosylase [Cyclobacteriaceae bacterium]HMV87996.1 A/G-specific adenine glycosylase [Cyclobacteriaceae bacterium]HMW98863.1 A/G-specific adenine glycosylase [Cyclobacteriaceae bacterium]HMX48504.1 A/G-specific adenine glycosylase [Cyclobacteriaceae bacterium]
MDSRYFTKKVVQWFEKNKRDLPWRETKDPYRIWLSEIILQQTRVSQGLPYYLKFVEAFPSVYDLANAPEQKVLRLWQGLGYYTRARNLHKCAKEVVARYNGIFPGTFDELKTLPGIGDYTAAAIASISFGQPVAVVDGNVFRVLARIFGIEIPINTPEGKRIFFKLANELVPQKNPDVHNQAMMEFGARFCTPRNPCCETCTFQKDCFAIKNSLQHQLPVKLQLKKARKRYFYYFVIQKGNSFLMKKREEKDIWHGLYDFVAIETKRPVDPEKLFMENDSLKKFRNGKLSDISGMYKHILSHQLIYSRFTQISLSRDVALNGSGLKFYSLKKLADLPKPVLISKFLSDYGIL